MIVPLVYTQKTLFLLDSSLEYVAGGFSSRGVFLFTNPPEKKSTLAGQVLLLNMVLYSLHGRDANRIPKILGNKSLPVKPT